MAKKRAAIIFISLIFFFSSSLAFAGIIKGKVSTKKVKVPKDILVYVEKVEGKEFPLNKTAARMDQISLVFTPRVIPVVRGSDVEFKNSDDVLHNVFAVGDDEFDLGTWKGDAVRKHTFDNLGEVAILCNVHPEMEAYIVVLQNPYFALTDEQGNYRIKDVPAGNYKLKTWHERLRPVTQEVSVSEQSEAAVDFSIR